MSFSLSECSWNLGTTLFIDRPLQYRLPTVKHVDLYQVYADGEAKICWKYHYEGDCLAEEEQNVTVVEIMNCNRVECPRRVKENEVTKIKAVERVSYAEAVKGVERYSSEGPMLVDRPTLQPAEFLSLCYF